MMVYSPTASTRQPHYYEGSPLRSRRDSDAVTRAWLKTKAASHRNNNTNNQQFFLLQKLGRNRRRVVGGGGSTSSGGLNFKGEYSGSAYSSQDMVVFVPDGGAVGTYIALRAVPAGVAPDVGNPYWLALPFPPAGIFA